MSITARSPAQRSAPYAVCASGSSASRYAPDCCPENTWQSDNCNKKILFIAAASANNSGLRAYCTACSLVAGSISPPPNGKCCTLTMPCICFSFNKDSNCGSVIAAKASALNSTKGNCNCSKRNNSERPKGDSLPHNKIFIPRIPSNLHTQSG